jgi:hypothetical protein
MADRTTRFLLFCIALALWGLLLRPAFTPIATKAAGSDGGQLIVVGEGQAARLFFLTPSGGKLYRFSPEDLSVRAYATFDPAKDTYVNHTP